MKVSEVLTAAADIVDVRGWWQKGNPATSPEGRCVLTAIWSAGMDDELVQMGAVAAMERWLGVVDAPAVGVWNDDPARSKLEVTVALRAAALVEAEREVAAAADSIIAAALSVPVFELAVLR